jgi:L-fuconolactonase
MEAVFDTHAHLISADQVAYPPSPMHGPLRPVDVTAPFDADQLIARMDEAGVSHGCAVQRGHIYGYNNSYILDSARRYPKRLTPIIMLAAANPETPDLLRRLSAEYAVGGIRLAAARVTDYDTGWFNSSAALKTWETAAELRLPVALIFFARHLSYNLPALKLIAASFPQLPIVIDHVGVPHGSNYEVKWTEQQRLPAPYLGPPDYAIGPELLALRPCRNVYFKLTGINFERFADNRVEPADFVRRFVDEFGADHLMWGSDIGQTQGPYERLVNDARSATRRLNAAERALVLSETAARIYPTACASRKRRM